MASGQVLLVSCGVAIAAGSAAIAGLGDVRQGYVAGRVWGYLGIFAGQMAAYLAALLVLAHRTTRGTASRKGTTPETAGATGCLQPVSYCGTAAHGGGWSTPAGGCATLQATRGTPLRGVRALVRRGGRARATLVVGLGAALGMRTILTLFAWPNLSDDIHRYVWEGKAQQVGINPYLVRPDDAPPSLRASPEGQAATHGHVVAVYPPVTELTFRLLYPVARTARGYRWGLLLFDLGTVGLLAALLGQLGLSPLWSLAYAWHPLVLSEFGGGGHFDSVGIFWMVAAVYLLRRRRGVWAYAGLGLAVLTKYLAAPLAVFFWPRTKKRHALILIPVVLIAFWPYLPRGYVGLGEDLASLVKGEAVGEPTWRIFAGLAHFAARYDSNGGLHRAVLRLTGEGMAHDPAARLITGGLFLALVIGMWLRRTDLLTAGLFTIGGAVVLGRMVHPWYATWLVPWLALRIARGRRGDRLSSAAWLWFTGTVSVSYVVLIDYLPTRHDPYPRWQVPAWAMWLQYAPLVVLLAADSVWRVARGRTGVGCQVPDAGKAGTISPRRHGEDGTANGREWTHIMDSQARSPGDRESARPDKVLTDRTGRDTHLLSGDFRKIGLRWAAGILALVAGVVAVVVAVRWRAVERPAGEPRPGRRVVLEAAALREEAIVRVRAGHWDEALGLLETALDADPSNTALRRDLSTVLVKLGVYERAIVVLKEAIAAEPKNAALHADLARACLEAQRYGDAELAAREAFALAPDDRHVRALLGTILMVSRSPAEALPYLLAVAAVGPPDPHLDTQVGQCLLDLGRIDEAVARLLDCVRRLPDEVDVHERYQDALVAFGQLHDARLLYADRAKRMPSDMDALYLMARLHPPGPTADEALNRVLKIDPEHGRARTRLATDLAAQDRGEEALSLLYEGLESKSDNPSAILALVEVLAGLGRYDEADQVLQRRLRYHPYAVPFHTTRIHLRLERGDLAGAQVALAEALVHQQAVGALRRAELLRAASWVELWAACAGTDSPVPGNHLSSTAAVPPAWVEGSRWHATAATRRAASRPAVVGAVPTTGPAAGDQSAAALEHLDRAEALARGAPRFLNRCRFDRAMAYLCLGRHAQALATLAAMETAPTRPSAHLLAQASLYRGILLAHSGQVRSAAAAWRRAVEVDRDRPMIDATPILAARHLLGEAPAEEVEAALKATPVRSRPVLFVALFLRARSQGQAAAARQYAQRGLALPLRRLHDLALLQSSLPPS